MKNDDVVQVTVSVLVGGHSHPEPLPDGLENTEGTVSVTVVGTTMPGLPHAAPGFVTVMAKFTVCPTCKELSAAVLVITKLHGGGAGTIVTNADAWLFAWFWSG